MARVWLFGIALGLALGPVYAAPPAAVDEDARAEARDAEWSTRLQDAQLRREDARRRVIAAEAELTKARHRKRPRGDALEALERAVEDSREALDAAEQELPVLLEQARLVGVSPAVLLRFDPDDADGAADASD
jgi:hypothetical protein